MSALESIFKHYCEQMLEFLRNEKHVDTQYPSEQLDLFGQNIAVDVPEEELRHALQAYAFDGTELHHVVDRALPGLENERAATIIKHAIQAKYSNSITIDAAVERVMTLLEKRELP
jgi:hypothetical protein